MKKQLQMKKFSLHKETLRNLSGHEMAGVAGGFTRTCCNSSDPSVSCDPTCIGCLSDNTGCC
jgi:hypothetical protein